MSELRTETYAAVVHRLEVFRDNLGTWRWRARAPEGVVAHSNDLFALRDEARASGEEWMAEKGLSQGEYHVWMDGLSEHELITTPPRVDQIAEARAAGLDPVDQEAAKKAQRELEARKEAALKRRQEQLAQARPDEGMDLPDAVQEKHKKQAAEELESNPIVQQAQKGRKAREA